MSRTAAILSIGDELTSGATVDTNSAWLSGALQELSIRTLEHRTVGDDVRAIADAIGALAADADVLLITGGLGPTADDLTRDALAEVVTPGEALVEDQAALAHLESMFRRRNAPMPDSNRRQALRPRTASILPNPNGTAPGLLAEHNGCVIAAMPGPPRELQPMFRGYIAPRLRPSQGDQLAAGCVRALGLGEAAAAERLGDLMQRGANPTVGTTVSGGIVTARVLARDGDASKLLARTLQAIERLWHPYAFSRDRSLEEVMIDLLAGRKLTLATAESCTGGLLASRLVDVAGSSRVLQGGWVTYANEMKVKCLGVSDAGLRAHGAVSAPIAEAMARGARERAGANIGIGITGIAGPDGGTTEKPVGTVFIGVDTGDECVVRRFLFSGNRQDIRERAASTALQLLRFILLGHRQTRLLWEAPAESAPGATSRATSPLTTSTAAFIAIGSNLGDRQAMIDAAIRGLAALPDTQLVQVSPTVETAPVGPPGQGPYLNAAAELRTSLSPQVLLQALLEIERSHGRDRREGQRWGPRTLDLDLLLYGSAVIDEQGLTVPHPRLHERDFVLQPLARIAPATIHPLLGKTIEQLLTHVRQESHPPTPCP